MTPNPYQPTSQTPPRGKVSAASRPFPFWTVGPASGAFVGLNQVLGGVLAWSRHGFPDFLFRSGESAFLFAILLSIGGALFGMAYATVVALCCRLFGRHPRPRPHFWIAGLASLAVAYLGAEISLQQRELVSPFLLLAVTVGLAFVTALLVSDSPGAESRTSHGAGSR